jgi:hypothetical protein
MKNLRREDLKTVGVKNMYWTEWAYCVNNMYWTDWLRVI